MTKHVIKEVEKVDPEVLEKMKESIKEWENKRKAANLDKMTLKERISNMEIGFAHQGKHLEDDNKNINRIYLLLALQAMFNLGVLLTITALK